jgi:hypothetical protein
MGEWGRLRTIVERRAKAKQVSRAFKHKALILGSLTEILGILILRVKHKTLCRFQRPPLALALIQHYLSTVPVELQIGLLEELHGDSQAHSSHAGVHRP